MNKKTFVLIAAAVVILILLILLGLRSCEPRVKDEEGNEIPQTIEEEIPQNLPEIDDQYKNAFINTNVDFVCQVRLDNTIVEDKFEVETRVREAYEKYGLPVEENETMLAILKKYENDEEVAATIRTNSAPCSQGQDPIIIE